MASEFQPYGEVREPSDLIKLPWDVHCVVVAGPGAGKTWLIANRVEDIVRRGDCAADEIAVLSLTQSTARQLQQDVPYGNVGTFHSFSLSQLNAIGDAVRRRIVDPWEQKQLIIPDLQLLLGENKLEARAIRDFFDRLGAGFQENQTGPPQLSPDEKRLRERWLFLRRFMEFRLFDELAYDLLRHLESGGELRRPLKVILVDEYQDLNPCELTLLHAIAGRHGSFVFACGDDRQSIFGFRHADALALNNFCGVYGLERPEYLSVTKRCPGVVCKFAEEIAGQIPPVAGLSDRPPLRPKPGLPPGEVRIRSLPSTIAEVRWVHEQIKILLDGGTEGTPSDEVMVIVPHSLEVYLHFLNEVARSDGSEVTYYDTRAHDPLCAQAEFRSLYAFTRLAVDVNDHLAWRTLLHLAHGYGATFTERVLHTQATTFAAALRRMAALDERAAGFVRGADETLARLRCSGTLGEVCDVVGDWLREVGGISAPSWQLVMEVPELAGFACAEASAAAGSASSGGMDLGALSGALLAAASACSADRPAGERQVGVHTIYQAKGLQADHVFLMGAFTEAFVDSTPADGIRRLYVAVTRAKRSLAVTMGRMVKGRRNPLWRYLGKSTVDLSPHIVEAAQRAGVRIERQ
jgi:DNA helicase-2/ATP-dependent DNA helicase PcrA